MPTTFTILYDNREKNPLPFPAHLVLADPSSRPHHRCTQTVRLVTMRRHLETADYLLADEPGIVYTSPEHPPRAVIETKRTLSEIAHNVLDTTGRRKFVACLKRLAALGFHGRAFLVVEGGLQTLYSERPSPLPIHPPRAFLVGTAVPDPGPRNDARDGGGGPPFPPDPCAIDAFLSLCFTYGVHPYLVEGLSAPQRRRTADFVARLLILGGCPHHPSADDTDNTADEPEGVTHGAGPQEAQSP